MFKDSFGFAEYQKKNIYGLDYKLTLTQKSDNAVLDKGNAINNAKFKFNSIGWYVAHYTPSLAQEKKRMGQIVYKKPTELRYVKPSVFMKEVIT